MQINGHGIDIQKDPVTDDGTKKSTTGRLAVRLTTDGVPCLIQNASPEQEADQALKLVYENGKLLQHNSFAEVRANLRHESNRYLRRTEGAAAGREA
ncbi:hypothetical protein [Mycobacterium sp. 050134]|uniref:hypothetical protein n=1 Tax=Mycobacterium sp. 050134 TaxID=3096111 RepID=UPI002ED7A08B